MAYAFDRINRAIEDKEEEKEKPVMVSSAVELNNPSSTASSASPILESSKQQKFNKFNPSSASEAKFQAFKGKAEIPGFIGKIGEDLSQREQDITNAANAWKTSVSDETKRLHGVTDEEIDRALREGDNAEFKKITKLLGLGLQDINKPVLPDSMVVDPKDIQNPEKIRQLYRKEAGTRYTPGMSEFDLNILTSTPEFNRKIGELSSQQQRLSRFAGEEYDKKLAELKTEDAQSLDRTKQAIKSYLEQQQGRLTQDQIDEANYLTSELEKMHAHTSDLWKSRETRLKEDILNNLKQKLGDSLGQEVYNRWLSENSQQDLSKNISITMDRGKKYNPDELYTEQEKNRYNKILGLLKKTDKAKESSTIPNLEDYIKLDPNASEADRAAIVDKIFGEIKGNDLFTSRKNLLDARDLKSLLKDPSIGDYFKSNLGQMGLFSEQDLKERLTPENIFDATRYNRLLKLVEDNSDLFMGTPRNYESITNRFKQLNKQDLIGAIINSSSKRDLAAPNKDLLLNQLIHPYYNDPNTNTPTNRLLMFQQDIMKYPPGSPERMKLQKMVDDYSKYLKYKNINEENPLIGSQFYARGETFTPQAMRNLIYNLYG